MARPKQSRKVDYSPKVSYFKPIGINFNESEEVIMAQEEMETLRLIEVEGFPQEKAAESMKVSQPTFSRILKSSRKKIAEAVVLGKAIKIEGGNALIRKPFSLKSFKKSLGSY